MKSGAYYITLLGYNYGMKEDVFNAKGKAAEQLIAALCKDAFFEDFCFMNPYYAKGKELCDVLVILGEVAIIWQIKNIKLKNGLFSASDVNKAIKQCRGARRKLLQLGTVNFINTNSKNKTIDTTKIKEVFMIAAIEGGSPDFDRYFDGETNGNGNVHIFFEGLTRFATKHLNTVSDFVRYLRRKEKLLAGDTNIVLTSGEEDLLAFYLQNKRTFGNLETMENVDMMMVDLEGEANKLESENEEYADYAEKQMADHWSQGWDELIAKKRAGLTLDGKHAEGIHHDKFLQKMMQHNRFERRVLGRQFYDTAVMAANRTYSDWIVQRRMVPQNEHNVTYVFVFFGNRNTPQEHRRSVLYGTAMVAKLLSPQNDMLIAIASELHMVDSKEGYCLEWVMFDIAADEFEKEYGEEARKYQSDLNIWKEHTVKHATVWEYPSDARKSRNRQTKN